jgi:uncharacterized protein YuzE
MSSLHAMSSSYDSFADVLYVRVKDAAAKTRNMEESAGLVLRRDLETNRPVGATIIDYKSYWASHERHLIKHLAGFFEISAADVRNLISVS